MASISIQRHPNSKWVDDCYILVARARHLSLDWGNAIQTYKYVNTKSKDPNARHAAIIGLIHTFVDHSEFNNAQAAADFLQNEELDKTNKKNLLLKKAYLYQAQGDYDKMVRNLTEVTPLLRKKDKPGRIYFIIGQIYQKLGFESEAYNYYRKCIGTNPEYEVDFYARLYMAQVTEISRSRSVNAARKSFKKLLKDSKNKNFKDKIYYEMGVFELKQKNIQEGIVELNRSIREGSNKRIDGEAYLRLGEVYYDTLKNYELSQAYYDSAIASLPTDYEGYETIKERQEILNEFVKNLKTVQWQDSLLSMASLDSAALRARVESVVNAKKLEEEKKAGKKKKRTGGVAIESNTNSVFTTGEENETEQVAWYFGNPSAMALGQTEFKRIWGNITLNDNWRRSLRSATVTGPNVNQPTTADATQADTDATAAAAPVDPVAAEYERLNKEIPRTDQQKQEALAKIETAYFNLGDIYYFKLKENNNAVDYYTRLLKRFPKSEYKPEVLYKLHLILKDVNPTLSKQYGDELLRDFPESTFAKTLKNPNYLEESSQAAEKQKVLYKKAYAYYENNDNVLATHTVDEALELGQTAFVPNLKLLKILIIGRTENITQYQMALENFLEEYHEGPVSEYAKKLLQSSRDFEKNKEKQKGIQYVRSLEEPHYFVLVYRQQENLGNVASASLEKFNQDNFKDLRLKTSNLVLNEEYSLTLVADLPRVSSAIEYNLTFNEKLSSIPELRNHKFNTFVITKDNFDIFYRTKGLDEYLQFFEKNYPQQNQ
jgi:tetratricopeptide (TPR) repeat protein